MDLLEDLKRKKNKNIASLIDICFDSSNLSHDDFGRLTSFDDVNKVFDEVFNNVRSPKDKDKIFEDYKNGFEQNDYTDFLKDVRRWSHKTYSSPESCFNDFADMIKEGDDYKYKDRPSILQFFEKKINQSNHGFRYSDYGNRLVSRYEAMRKGNFKLSRDNMLKFISSYSHIMDKRIEAERLFKISQSIFPALFSRIYVEITSDGYDALRSVIGTSGVEAFKKQIKEIQADILEKDGKLRGVRSVRHILCGTAKFKDMTILECKKNSQVVEQLKSFVIGRELKEQLGINNKELVDFDKHGDLVSTAFDIYSNLSVPKEDSMMVLYRTRISDLVNKFIKIVEKNGDYIKKIIPESGAFFNNEGKLNEDGRKLLSQKYTNDIINGLATSGAFLSKNEEEFDAFMRDQLLNSKSNLDKIREEIEKIGNGLLKEEAYSTHNEKSEKGGAREETKAGMEPPVNEKVEEKTQAKSSESTGFPRAKEGQAGEPGEGRVTPAKAQRDFASNNNKNESEISDPFVKQNIKTLKPFTRMISEEEMYKKLVEAVSPMYGLKPSTARVFARVDGKVYITGINVTGKQAYVEYDSSMLNSQPISEKSADDVASQKINEGEEKSQAKSFDGTTSQKVNEGKEKFNSGMEPPVNEKVESDQSAKGAEDISHSQRLDSIYQDEGVRFTPWVVDKSNEINQYKRALKEIEDCVYNAFPEELFEEPEEPIVGSIKPKGGNKTPSKDKGETKGKEPESKTKTPSQGNNGENPDKNGQSQPVEDQGRVQ